MGNMEALRAVTVGRGSKQKITPVEIEGQTFGMRAASIADIEAIEKASGVKLGKSDDFGSNIAFAIAAIINQTVDPDTGEQVFTAADKAMFKGQSMDGWFKELVDSVGLCFPKTKKEGSEGNDSTEQADETLSATK